eukprot:scaffold54909_cov44-Attheya_sp.AAC.1
MAPHLLSSRKKKKQGSVSTKNKTVSTPSVVEQKTASSPPAKSASSSKTKPLHRVAMRNNDLILTTMRPSLYYIPNYDDDSPPSTSVTNSNSNSYSNSTSTGSCTSSSHGMGLSASSASTSQSQSSDSHKKKKERMDRHMTATNSPHKRETVHHRPNNNSSPDPNSKHQTSGSRPSRSHSATTSAGVMGDSRSVASRYNGSKNGSALWDGVNDTPSPSPSPPPRLSSRKDKEEMVVATKHKPPPVATKQTLISVLRTSMNHTNATTTNAT